MRIVIEYLVGPVGHGDFFVVEPEDMACFCMSFTLGQVTGFNRNNIVYDISERTYTKIRRESMDWYSCSGLSVGNI